MLGGPAAGQTSAELLQKGIYTQETVGDLDTAIRIYRQVVASASESRALGAQAQFRLAVCLLKKGDRAAAAKAFEQLIQDYPEQKELVAQAREYAPAQAALLPAPWEEGEVAEYRIKLPAGTTIGAFIYTVETNPSRPRSFVFNSRGYVGGVPQQWSRSEVDRDSMRPISMTYVSPVIGDFQIDYDGRQARVQPKGKDARSVPLDGDYWDNEEALWVLRRTPLSVGLKTKLPVVSPLGAPLKIGVNVTGIEEVQVKAGKYRCYKVELDLVRQVFYIAADGARPVVKMEANGVSLELESLRRADSGPVAYRDGGTGLSLTAPAGWLFLENGNAPSNETSVSMLDPTGRAFAAIWARTEKAEKSAIATMLREGVDAKVRDRSAFLKNYQVRPESVQPRAIGGQQALSCIADYEEQGRKMSEYLIWITAEKHRALFFARVPQSEMDAFRARFDAIVETARID
jgi:hypothetical protein